MVIFRKVRHRRFALSDSDFPKSMRFVRMYGLGGRVEKEINEETQRMLPRTWEATGERDRSEREWRGVLHGRWMKGRRTQLSYAQLMVVSFCVVIGDTTCLIRKK